MKVRIGPYINWIGPYQIADRVFFWTNKREAHKTKDRFADWLADTWVNGFCNWIHSKKKRKIKVKIDRYDTWDSFTTLAHIIHPLLVEFKKNLHGAPFVDDEDVPEELKSTNAEPKENEWDTDSNHFKRWDYVLDEMIWSFHQYTLDDWEEQYHSGNIDMYSEKVENGLYQFVDGPNHTFKVDREGIEKHSIRMDNGRRLFAKYYRSLWT